MGDPTRYAIFRYIADAGATVGVAELTDHFGFNHNAIRQHLAKLVSAGLLSEDVAPISGRGRPRLEYRVHPAADSRWGVAGPYERLTALLGDMIRTGDTPVDAGRRAGRRLPLAIDPAKDGVAFVVEAMERQGFDPVARRKGRRTDVVLQTCPFAAAALTDPETVCSLHQGLAEGFAERTGERVVVEALIPHDPRRAQCRLRLRTVEYSSEGKTNDDDRART
jgi:predicted ArsR family transcriptional regulator